MIKLSDYVFKYLESVGVDTAFTLTGGGIMHLVDSLGRSNIDYVCCHHEQSASIAAQAYDMYKEQLSVCLVTTGPGGTNALTGAAAAYVDSTPVIYMTGQVKRSDFASLRGVRQFGSQENDIISMAKPITKYAVLIMKAEDIAYELEKAVYIATHGRKGPVWIDIPLDVQAEMIDESLLKHFNREHDEDLKDEEYKEKHNIDRISDAVEYTIKLLQESKRPVFLLGQGAVSSKAYEVLEKIIRKLQIPVLTTWRAVDFMDSKDELYFGMPGLQAPRYSNLIIQHCDALVVCGSRLDNMITAFSEEHFAYRAKKVIVDIDECEIKKLNMKEVYPVVADVKDYADKLYAEIDKKCIPNYEEWVTKCLAIKKRFPLLAEKQDKEEGINLYRVTNEISKHCKSEDCIVISSTSRCNTAGHIAFQHRKGQKTISSMGMGSMGFALPSTIGAYYANKRNRVVMIEGDGSLQLNIQEFETIASHKINAKMFIFNNNGYAAITTMQDRNFDSFYVGSNDKSGLYMPDMKKIAYAYGIPYYIIDKETEIEEIVQKTMNTEGPVICDIVGSLWFDEIPKCLSRIDERTGKRVSAYLENPYPYLSEDDMTQITDYLLLG